MSPVLYCCFFQYFLYGYKQASCQLFNDEKLGQTVLNWLPSIKMGPLGQHFTNTLFCQFRLDNCFQNYKHTEIPKCFKHFMTIIFRQVNTCSLSKSSKSSNFVEFFLLSPLTFFLVVKENLSNNNLQV